MSEQENEKKAVEDSAEDASKPKETRPDPLITVIPNPYVKKLNDKFKKLGLR